jgi:hypothetical protein
MQTIGNEQEFMIGLTSMCRTRAHTCASRSQRMFPTTARHAPRCAAVHVREISNTRSLDYQRHFDDVKVFVQFVDLCEISVHT